jgi:cysteinyl-tRNA synthetase
VVLDLDADTATVVGLGVLTLRRDGVSTEIPTGETVAIDVLRQGPSAGTGTSTATAPTTAIEAPADTPAHIAAGAPSLAGDAARLGARFDEAIERRDPTDAVAAMLELDDAMQAWSTDTLQSDEMDRARALLRSMIVRLGEAAGRGLVDPHDVVRPFVEVALAARTEVRAAKRYDLSDQIRDGLAAAGVEVRDTPAGQTWDLITD